MQQIILIGKGQMYFLDKFKRMEMAV
jgi:hypothetical protein